MGHAFSVEQSHRKTEKENKVDTVFITGRLKNCLNLIQNSCLLDNTQVQFDPVRKKKEQKVVGEEQVMRLSRGSSKEVAKN